MKLDLKTFKEMDRHLPQALQPTPSGVRLDVSLYFREDEEGQKASIVLRDADGEALVDLFMDSPQGLALSMARLNYEGFLSRAVSARRRSLSEVARPPNCLVLRCLTSNEGSRSLNLETPR